MRIILCAGGAAVLLVAVHVVLLRDLLLAGHMRFRTWMAFALAGGAGLLAFLIADIAWLSGTRYFASLLMAIVFWPLLIVFAFFAIFTLVDGVKWRRLSNWRAAVFAGLLSVQAVNQAGFCWPELRFVGDRELVTLAYLAYYRREVASEEEFIRKVDALTSALPGCSQARRFQGVFDTWWISHDYQPHALRSLLGRSLGDCWVEVSVAKLDAIPLRCEPVSYVYVNACRQRADWIKGG
jgi:hypothetical protein